MSARFHFFGGDGCEGGGCTGSKTQSPQSCGKCETPVVTVSESLASLDVILFPSSGIKGYLALYSSLDMFAITEMGI